MLFLYIILMIQLETRKLSRILFIHIWVNVIIWCFFLFENQYLLGAGHGNSGNSLTNRVEWFWLLVVTYPNIILQLHIPVGGVAPRNRVVVAGRVGFWFGLDVGLTTWQRGGTRGVDCTLGQPIWCDHSLGLLGEATSAGHCPWEWLRTGWWWPLAYKTHHSYHINNIYIYTHKYIIIISEVNLIIEAGLKCCVMLGLPGYMPAAGINTFPDAVCTRNWGSNSDSTSW